MAKTVSYNRTDTAVAGNPTLTLPMAVLNYKADWRVKSEANGEAVLTNLTSPIDAPERLRFAVSDIKDVYKNTGIDPLTAAPSKKGVSVLCQLTDTWTVTDSEDATYVVNLPVAGHIVLRIPANENITSDMLKLFVGRLIDGLFETGLSDSTRLRALSRGVLLPADL